MSSSLRNRVAAIQKSSRTSDDGLDMLAVALPQGGDQLCVCPRPAGQTATARTGRGPPALSDPSRATFPRRSPARVSTRPRLSGQFGASLRKPSEQPASVSAGVAST